MEEQRRLPIFVAIHQKGIAEQEHEKRRKDQDRLYWKSRGMIDHDIENSQYSDEDTDRGDSHDSDSDSDSGGGKKKSYTNIKYTMKTRKNTNKNKKLKKHWSLKYKKSINCKRPRGFSQRQYCKYGRKK